MKLRTNMTTAALVLSSAPLFPLAAQMTGTSHPEALNDPIVTSAPQTTTPQAYAPQSTAPQTYSPQTSAHYVKPSPAIPMAQDSQAAVPALHARTAYNPDGMVVGDPLPATAPTALPPDQGYASPRMVASAAAPGFTHEDQFVVTDDINSGVVTEVPWRENELPAGTVLHARLDSEISTETTAVGSEFHARLTEPVEHNRHIILPVGTIVAGHVTELEGGRRIGGRAQIHLEPDMLTLPDGSHRLLRAQVIDLNHTRGAHVNDEGTIVGNDPSKGTVAAFGLAAAGGLAAGAVLGGGVGAVVGAGVGAGVATVVWLRHDSQETLVPGTDIAFSLNRPLMLENMVQ